MTVYYRYRSVSPSVDDSFRISLKNQVITYIALFVKNPSFDFRVHPIMSPIDGSTKYLSIDTEFAQEMSYANDEDIEVYIKETGGVANAYLFILVTGPSLVKPAPGKGW